MHRSDIKAVAGAVLAVLAALAAVIINSGTNKDDTSTKFRELSSASPGEVIETHNTVRRTTERTSDEKQKRTTAVASTMVHTKDKADEITTELYIDINSAGVSEICKLEGVGQAKAEAIVSYREVHGRFNNIEEIMLVNGIGEEIFSRIAGNIYVTDPVYTEPRIPETSETQTTTEEVNESSSEGSAVTTHTVTLEEAAPININTADPDELMLLPHVDAEIAGKIVELREKIGGYKNSYELLYIDELTQKQVAEIVKFVTVGQ